MNYSLLKKLQRWRDDTAKKERVEPYRVLPNATLEELARIRPTTSDALLEIKGIKDKKCARYGDALLALINNEGSDENSNDERTPAPSADRDHYSVGEYLDILNDRITRDVRVIGEVSSFDLRGNYLFYSLKDKNDGSMLRCFMWARDYRVSGIDIEEGMELIGTGTSEIYKPSGNLTFRTHSIELVGEGALKAAYKKLKEKLSKEGIFAAERKKPLPKFPHTIGLITSATGAVIHDFQSNLGNYGYHISFFDSRVEGQNASRDLLAGFEYFKNRKVDVLVVIRGGGSLESLQAFNNEMVVRAIAESTVPVVCGIGHDNDIPLASYAADVAVSTPTAAAVLLGRGWESGFHDLAILEREMLNSFARLLTAEKGRLDQLSSGVNNMLNAVMKRTDRFLFGFEAAVSKLHFSLEKIKGRLSEGASRLIYEGGRMIHSADERITRAERTIRSADPERQLALGYSIVSTKKRGVITSVHDVSEKDLVAIRVADGTIDTRVESIKDK